MKKKDKQHPRSASTGNTNYQQSSEGHAVVSDDELSNDSLKELAEGYFAILENSLNGTVVIEANTGKVLFANKTALNIFGFNSMKELGEANIMDYVHPDDRERAFLAIIKDFFSNSSHDQYEFRTITRYGEGKRVLTLSMPIKYQNKLAGVISLVDITERKKTEEALRDSGEKLRAMFESMAEAATITDLEGRIVDANPAAVKLHRYDNKQEIIGIKAYELVAERDRERAVKDSINTLKTGKTQLTEYKLTTKGGTLIDGEFCTAVVRDHSGNPTGFIGISRDISDRKRMEEKLRESDRKLQTVFGTITDGIVVTDMMGMIIDANEAAVSIGKYKNVEDIIGRSGIDFITENDRKKVAKMLSAAIADPKRMHGEVIEYIAQDKSGTPFYGESSAAVIRDSSGKPTGMIFVTRDITERKLKQDKTREDQEKLRTVFESISDGIAITDALGTVTEINDSWVKIGGYNSKDELIGKNSSTFIVPQERDIMIQRMMKRFEVGSGSEKAIYKFLKKDGQEYDVELTVGMLHDKDGKVTGLVTIGRDITQQKRSLELLQASEERYRLLAENISDVIWIMDMNLRFTYISPSIFQLRGYTSEEAVSQPLEDNVTPESLEVISKIFAEELLSEDAKNRDPRRTRTFLAELKCKDGSTVWTEQKLSFLYDKDNHAIGILGLTRDISERKKAEEALQSSEEKLRVMFDNMTDGIIVVDMEGLVVDLNEAAFRMSGFSSKEELIGVNALDFIAEKDRERVTNDLMQTMSSMKAGGNSRTIVGGNFVYSLLRKDGSTFDCEFNVAIIKDSSGTTVGFIAVERDVTERRKAEEAVLARDRYFRAIMDLSSGAMLVLGSDGKIADTSGGLERISGYRSEQTIGMPATDFIHPDDVLQLGVVMAEIMESPGKTVSVEARLRNAQGAWQWTECMITNLLDHPDVRGIVTHLIDISERKRAEEAMRLQEIFYRRLIEKSPDAIIIIDAQGMMHYGSPSMPRLLGYGEDERIGDSAFDFVHPEDVGKVVELFALIANTPGASDQVEARVKHKDGSWRWVQALGTNHLDDPAVQGVVVNLRDVTERRKADELLRASEERYRLLADNISDVIWILSLDFKYLYLSPSIYQLRGYTVEEAMQTPIEKTVTPPSLKYVVKVLNEEIALLKAGTRNPHESRTLEVELYRKDGSTVWTEMKVGGLYDKDNNLTSLIGSTRDITKRKRAEESVRLSEEKLRSVFSSMNDAVVITNEKEIILDVNDAAFRVFGYKKEDLIGTNGLDLLVEGERERALKSLANRLFYGTSLERDDYQVKTADGRIAYADITVSNMIDPSGNLAGFVTVLRDVTERRSMEEAVRASGEMLNAVFESMKEGIAVVDKDIKFIRWNQALLDIAGLKAEEMMGKSGLDFLIEEDRMKAADDLVKQLMGVPLGTPVYRVRLPSGIIKHVEMSISNLKDGEGNVTGFVTSIRDITERIRMERDLLKALDDLQRSNKDLEQFVYVASHDMQEPLRMVASYTQLLGKRYKGKLDSDADEFIGFAVDGASRMQKMINDLLIFSRVTTRGKEFEPVDLEKVFSDAVDNLKIAIEESKANITHDQLPKVMADEPQMVRLLQNLIGNSIKFHGQEPPIIHVGAKEGKEEWAISVKDNGIGIDKKFFDRLFIVFQRLHTRDQYPGTGIGLAVCKKTVERHGGRIWVESEGEGKGSAFTFTLPKRALTKKVEPDKSLQGNDQKNNSEKKEARK